MIHAALLASLGLLAQAGSKPASAPASRPASDLSAALEEVRRANDVAGLAAAIVDDRGLLALGVAGLRARGDAAPVSPDDRFHLGSCTKSMTATMIATLVEEGKLSWGTTVGEVYASSVAAMNPLWRSVTLEQLLTNRGGAPADLNADGLWGKLWGEQDDPVKARSMLVNGVLARPPLSPPGEKYLYSNAGFSIAGAMAETITKIPWEELMRRRIFTPLGMESAGFGAPGGAASVDAPRGHVRRAAVAPGPAADNPPAISPAGRVHCSLADWGKYISLHLRGEGNPKKNGLPGILKPETFLKLHAPAAGEPAYAMGWGVAERPWAGGRVLTHSGSNTMWFCVVWIAPKKNFAVLAACNEAGDAGAKACDDASAALIQRYPSVRR